jgi:hypothetical protein
VPEADAFTKPAYRVPRAKATGVRQLGNVNTSQAKYLVRRGEAMVAFDELQTPITGVLFELNIAYA